MKKTMKDRRYGGESVMPVSTAMRHNPLSFRCLTPESRQRKESFAKLDSGIKCRYDNCPVIPAKTGIYS
jgi:hypothetical protein